MAYARWAAAALCLAGAAAVADEPAPRAPAQQQLLDIAALALMRGDAAAALRDYEAAAAREHSLDIELGIVRSLMRGGEYRRALSFAAHSAGAHGDDVRGALLYARLLDLGGQGEAARRVLDGAAMRAGHAAALSAARQSIAWEEQAMFEPLPAGSQVTAVGALVDGGRRALVPAASLGGATTLAVLDGLGRSVQARVVDHDERLGVALLVLEPPFDASPRLQAPPREPFPGVPAYAVGASCAVPRGDCAVWPRLHLGFLGSVDAANGERTLGIEVGSGPLGGPVFDASGRWLGIALPGSRGARLLSSRVLGERFGLTGDANVSAPLSADALYEVAMRVSLQAIVPRRAD